MKPSRRLWIAGSVLALAAAFAGVVVLVVAEPGRQRQRLPDGRLLELEGATYGRQHAFPDRRGWRSWWSGLWDRVPGRRPALRSVVPAGARSGPHPTQSEALLVWYRESRGGRPSAGVRYDPQAADEHGCRFGLTEPFSWDYLINARGAIVERLGAEALSSFPRRSGTVTLGFYSYPDDRLVARFSVANPVPGPYPVWQAPPYPVSARSAATPPSIGGPGGPDLELQVTGMRHRRRARFHRSGITYRVLDHGRPVDWAPFAAEVSDATGNRISRAVRQEGNVAWFNGLCVKESAWKLRLELAPGERTPADGEWTWTTPLLPLPKPGHPTPSPAYRTKHGATIRVATLNSFPQPRRGAPAPAVLHVHVDVREVLDESPPERGVRTRFLSATDERGRPVVLERVRTVLPDELPVRMQSDGTRARYYAYFLRAPGDARALKLTLACQPTRFVELLVRP